LFIEQVYSEVLDFLQSLFQPEISRFVSSLIVVAVIVVVYKLLSRSISKLSKRLELDPHIQNSLKLILRVVTLVILTSTLFAIYQLPLELVFGGSALVGAAIGFGSSQTINNIVAGFYVILSRPFKVRDYVKIGDVEGEVEEITINYTKLYTPSFNILLVPNVQVINSRVLNCTHEGLIKYTFSLSIPHTTLPENFIKEIIEPAIEEFQSIHKGLYLRKPEGYFETSTNLGQTFKIRIFIPKGEARILYDLQPDLSYRIINRWNSRKKG
jgi:small conductance mechanosensitive channel